MSKNKNGWDRSLGTSKKEQGIVTPPPPRYKRLSNGKLACHCLFRGKDLWQECLQHVMWKRQQALMQELMESMQKEEETKKDESKE